MTEKRLAIVVDPSGAKSGADVVKREFKDIGREAVATERRVNRFGRTGRTALDQFGRAARRSGRAVDGFSRSNERAARSAQSLERGVARVTAAVTAFATAATVLAFRSGIQLNRALTEVGTLSTNARDNLDNLRDSARRLAIEFGGNSTENVRAYYQAISAGVGTAKQASEFVRESTRLAKAGVTDTVTAVDILTTATNAYRVQGLGAAEASDALFTAVRLGKTTVPELATGLGAVIPIAASLEVRFDELLAATAALTTQGQSTSQAITGIRGVLVAITRPTQQAIDLTSSLGIEFNTAALRAKGLQGFLAEIVGKTGGSKEALAKIFSDVEALNAAMAFSGGASQVLIDNLAEMENKAGATDEALKVVTDSLSFRFDAAVSRMRESITKFGTDLLPTVVPALERLSIAFERQMILAVADIRAFEAAFLLTKDTVSTAFNGLAAGIADGVISAVNFMSSQVVSAVNTIIGAVNAAIDGMNALGAGFERIDFFSSDTGQMDNPFAGAVAQVQLDLAKARLAYELRINEIRNRVDRDIALLDDPNRTTRLQPLQATDTGGAGLSSSSEGNRSKGIDDILKGLTNRQSALDRLRAETDALRDQEKALGMTKLEATAFLKEKQILASAARSGQTLTAAETAQIKQQAQAYAAASLSLERSREAIDFTRSTFKGFFTDLLGGLREGKTLWQAFGDAAVNALSRIADRLFDMAIDNMLDGLVGGAGANRGGLDGLLSGLVNAGSSRSNAAHTPAAAPLSQTVNAVAQQAWNFFSGKGLADHQVAGILGHMKAESAFNPLAVGDSGNAFGLFQHNDRSPNLFRFLGGRQNLGNVQRQLEFAWHELMTTENRAFQNLSSSGNVRQAVNAFGGFERPLGFSFSNPEAMHNYVGRLRAAEQALQQFSGSVDSTGSSLGDLRTGASGLTSQLAGGAKSLSQTAVEFANESQGLTRSLNSGIRNLLNSFPSAPASIGGGGGIAGWVSQLLSSGFGGSQLQAVAGGAVGLFEPGGYTGDGATHQVKGLVHAKEYVFSAKATQAIGVGTLEALHQNALRGFQEGGYVGGNVIPFRGMNNFTIRLVNNEGKELQTQESQTADGIQIDVFVDNLVASKIGSQGSKTNKALRNVFGNRTQVARR